MNLFKPYILFYIKICLMNVHIVILMLQQIVD
jgi:hypothetical protein